jgi:hypothetical protein
MACRTLTMAEMVLSLMTTTKEANLPKTKGFAPSSFAHTLERQVMLCVLTASGG